jgi:starvation-inducible DNA-binding protein
MADRERMVCSFKIDPSFLDAAPQNYADLIEEGSKREISRSCHLSGSAEALSQKKNISQELSMARKASKSKSKATRTGKDMVNIGLDAPVRSKVVALLNQLLADEFVLYAQARAFHWNVTGRHFHSDHGLFEEEYTELDETIDTVAERARALGGKAQASLTHYLANARIREVDSTGLTAEQMIATLLAHHEALVRILRVDSEVCDDLEDEGTTDFLTGLMEAHEKRAWMLRSHLS